MKFIDAGKMIEFYQRLSKREKLILYVSAAIVLLLTLDQLIVGPIFRTMRKLDQQTQAMEDNIKQSIRLLGQKEQMMKESAHYAAYAVSSKSAEDEILALLKLIQDLASQTSVNLLYSKPGGAGGEAKEPSTYRISLECEGQMDQLIAFFYAIETSKMLLRVEKYTLQPTAKGSSVIKCAATISKTEIR